MKEQLRQFDCTNATLEKAEKGGFTNESKAQILKSEALFSKKTENLAYQILIHY